MRRCIFLLLALVFSGNVAGAVHAEPAREPTRIILDTDMWGDIDDVFALAMLHALASRGEANILAVTVSTPDHWCASFVDLMDTYYGRPDIPIGMVSGRDGQHPGVIPAPGEAINYTQALSLRRDGQGAMVFPHRITADTRLPDAVMLLRKTLAAQPDRSVVIVQIGYSTNLARLLDSGPDQASALSGPDLVKRKVKLLSVMGGQYGDAVVDGHRQPAGEPEFNLASDIPSSVKLFSGWPTPIVAAGFEAGYSVQYSGASIGRDFRYSDRNPVEEVYRYTDPLFRGADTPAGQLHDHAVFDAIAVLYAVRPGDDYFSLSGTGRIDVGQDGSTRFTAAGSGRDRYVVLNPAERIRMKEAIQMLVSQPPDTARR